MLVQKDSVIQILQSAMDQIVLLPDASGSDQQAQIDELKAQVLDLQGKVDAASASLAAEVQKEADLQAQKDAADQKIAKALADLQGV